MKHSTELINKIHNAPCGPGCYLYQDHLGNIIYVGKAKVLRKRVKQYFQRKPAEEKLQQLVSLITDVTYEETASELDALILEYKLIKQYKPWFNTQLKRDRQHPMLEIDVSQPYITLAITNRREKKDAVYIDCFRDIKQIMETLELLNRVWKIPICGKRSFSTKTHPCLNYHLGRCLGPCSKNINMDQYNRELHDLLKFVDQKEALAVDRLKKQINAHAESLEFEKAGQLNQYYNGLKSFQRRCNKLFTFPDNKRVILLIRPFHSMDFSIFYVACGKGILRQDFSGTLDERKLKDFLDQIEKKEIQMADEELLKGLAEIYAEKHYIEVLPRKRRRWIQTEIEAVCEKFLY